MSSGLKLLGPVPWMQGRSFTETCIEIVISPFAEITEGRLQLPQHCRFQAYDALLLEEKRVDRVFAIVHNDITAPANNVNHLLTHLACSKTEG